MLGLCDHCWSDWKYPESKFHTTTLGIQERFCHKCKIEETRVYG